MLVAALRRLPHPLLDPAASVLQAERTLRESSDDDYL
jgi:hypothetical protein